MSHIYPTKHFHFYLLIYLGQQKTIPCLGPCLENYEPELILMVYLYFLSKMDLRKCQPCDILWCLCIKIIVENTVLYTVHFSSTKWHTFHLSFRLEYCFKLCSPWNVGMLPPFWKWGTLNCCCYAERSKPSLNLNYDIHVHHYDGIYAF